MPRNLPAPRLRRESAEDPRDFRRLHRDVAALFPPQDVTGDAAVQLLVQRERHGRWRVRLGEVLGSGLGGPADARRKIERRLFAFGATKATRTYPRAMKLDSLLDEFQAECADILAGAGQNAAVNPEPARTEAGEGVK